jgi:superfamily II DNA/RNA helicase
VDRALDPRLLEEALGEHSRLPSPEELGGLLAQAEINLFLGEATEHERMLMAGWYLHSLAGGRLDLVGAVRRQQAGRVSAHIFDVFVQGADADLSYDERLRYTIAAQYGYLVGDLAPNATALLSQLRSETPAISEQPGRASMHAAAMLLGLDRRRLRGALDAWSAERVVLSNQWPEVDNSPFGPAVATIVGVEHLLGYLLTGAQAELEAAAGEFQRALSVGGGEDDVDSRWVAALLSDLGGNLASSSVWAVLPPDLSPTARALVLSDPAVLLFWPPQARFLLSDPSPLDPATRRQVLAFPTSAGKTLVSQVMILSHLQTASGDVCVVAPTHSLCREIREALEPRLGLLRTSVADAGPLGAGVELPTTGRVVVMTPERFAGLLRNNPTYVLERFGLVVIDEAHLLAERERGWGLEEALTLLHHLTRDSGHRLVLVSAAMGVSAHMVSWLTTDKAPLVRSDNWRGPRRLYALYTTEFDPNDAHTVVEPQVGARMARRRVPVLGRVYLRQAAEQPVVGTLTEPVGTQVFRRTRQGEWARDQQTRPQLSRVVPLIEHLVEDRNTPTLVIVATREDARKLASLVAEQLPVAPEVGILAERVQQRVGEEHALPGLIRRGVAYHHGALPTDVQAEIEDAARARQLRCLVATATLTEGVNLPFKAVVIASTGYGPESDFVEIIDPPRLVNALGRAGRAGKETEAWLFLVRHGAYKPAMFDQLRQQGADLPLQSSLLAQDSLDELAYFEEVLAEGEDAALKNTGLATNEFCAFVWRLAELLGALGEVADLESIMAVVESSLAWAEADEPIRGRWRNLVSTAKDSYDRTRVAARRRYARSGASLAGAAVLDGVVGEAVEAVILANPNSVQEWIDALLGEGRLDTLLQLPENGLRSFKPYRTAPGGKRLDVDLLAMLHQWVAGAELESIGAEFLGEIENADYRAEALSEFTSGVFEHHLPWVLGSFIEWINEDLAARGLPVVVPMTITSHIHFGVATTAAIELMTGGVRSRRLAQAVADVLGADNGNLRADLAALGLTGWRSQLGAFPSELRDLLTFVRRAPKVMTDVLEGGTGLVPVTGNTATNSGPARLVLDESETEPWALQVVIGGKVVGQVGSEFYTEVRQLLELGFALDVHFDLMDSMLSVGLAATTSEP